MHGRTEHNFIYTETYQKDKNAPVQSINGGHPDGEKRTLSQTCGPDGQVTHNVPDETTTPEGWKKTESQGRRYREQTGQVENEVGRKQL